MTPANLHMEWAALLLDGFAAAGVEDVVVSPGSRSTPFVLAAAMDDRFRMHTAIDERCAAFFALGQAKATGRPSLLIATSGTAAAHYLPAVIEASESRTPLLALTADRPPELHRAGAPQTTDQSRLFGLHARASIELGLPSEDPTALRAVRRAAIQAAFRSLHPDPGPVQVNGWLRKPLEPVESSSPADVALRELAARIRREAPSQAARPMLTPDATALAGLAEATSRTRRGVIVCGPAQVAQGSARAAIERLAEITHFPILSETTSQVRFIQRAADVDGGASKAAPRSQAPRFDGFDAAYRSAAFREQYRPDLVIQIGAPPTSEGWRRLLQEDARITRFIIAANGWPDPECTASSLVVGDTGEVVDELAETLQGTIPDEKTAWERALLSADRIVWRAVTEELAASEPVLTGGELARGVAERLPPASLLALGNSLPIRDMDTFCPGTAAAVAVLSQCGVRGIDGLVSGAAGAATRWNNPVTLFLGDISFLHDLGGLMLPEPTGWPLVVVVASNGGGRIFEELPVAANPALRTFVRDRMIAPHGLDLAHAAALFKHEYRRVTSGKALRSVLMEAYTVPFCTIVEATVPPETVFAQHQRLWQTIDMRLREGLTETA